MKSLIPSAAVFSRIESHAAVSSPDMDSKSSGAFSAADINFIQDLHDNMRRDIANGREYGGLLSTISRHLERFQEASITAAALEEFPSWGPVVCIPDASPGNDQRAVQITGPLIDDHFQITTASSPEMAEIVRNLVPQVACSRLTLPRSTMYLPSMLL